MQASTRGRPRAVEFPPAARRSCCLPLGRRLRLRPKEGGGRNATGLARPSQRLTHPPTGELSPMAFLGGGVCRGRGPSPPPGASSGLSPAVECVAAAGDSRAKPRTHRPPPPHDEGNAFVIGGGEAAARRIFRNRTARYRPSKSVNPGWTPDARDASRATRGADCAPAVLLRLGHPGLRVLRRLRAQRAGGRHAVDLRRADDERASAGRAPRCRARCRWAA